MKVEDLVADFLRENNYLKTLETFEREYGKAFEGPVKEGLSEIVQDRYATQQIALQDEKRLENDEDPRIEVLQKQVTEWKLPYPRGPTRIARDINELVLSTCLINYKDQDYLFCATVKGKIFAKKLPQDVTLAVHEIPGGSAAIKKLIPFGSSQLLVLTMNGALHLCNYQFDKVKLQVLYSVSTHQRLLVDAKAIGLLCVTLGWDRKIKVFHIENQVTFLCDYELPLQGTAFDLIEYRDQIMLVVGISDSSVLHVLTLHDNSLRFVYRIALCEAQYMVDLFSPRSISILQTSLSPLVAVGTSHEPFMRIIVTRLDIPRDRATIRRDLVLRNINSHLSQNKFSQSLITWRVLPDHSTCGIWALGDDGLFKGIDLITGAVYQNEGFEGRAKCFVHSDSFFIASGSCSVMWLP